MSESLAELEHQRAAVLRQIPELGDFRPGSMTGTGGVAALRIAIVTAPMIRDTHPTRDRLTK